MVGAGGTDDPGGDCSESDYQAEGNRSELFGSAVVGGWGRGWEQGEGDEDRLGSDESGEANEESGEPPSGIGLRPEHGMDCPENEECVEGLRGKNSAVDDHSGAEGDDEPADGAEGSAAD